MIKDKIQSYYRTERISSVVLAIVGAISSTIGLVAYILTKTEIALGLMLGLCLVGCYQIIVGLVRLFRSRPRFKNAILDVDQGQQYLLKTEYPRVVKKENLIKKMRHIELNVVIISVFLLAILFFVPQQKYFIGTLAGLCFHAGFLLSFDLFSQFRIQEYIHQLKKFLKI